MPENIARKLARRTAQLEHAASKFEFGVHYSERQVNEVLANLFHDHVFARRLMIDFGLLDRFPDGSKYWVAAIQEI
jgi:hypothetical protein